MAKRRRLHLESLEARQLFAAVVSTALPSPFAVAQNTDANPVSTYIPLTSYFQNTTQAADKVVVDTQMGTYTGSFTMTMLPDKAPKTVSNFLNYVNSGAYDNTIFHRLEPGFVLQAGGYALSNLSQHIPQNAPVENEFSATTTVTADHVGIGDTFTITATATTGASGTLPTVLGTVSFTATDTSPASVAAGLQAAWHITGINATLDGGGNLLLTPTQGMSVVFTPSTTNGDSNNNQTLTASTPGQNLIGTVAMAKVDGNPNSATSEWFINLADNSTNNPRKASNLDNQNGGFTVFANVTDDGLSSTGAVTTLSAAPTYAIQNTPFSSIPLTNYAGTSTHPVSVTQDNLVKITHMAVVNGLTYTATSTDDKLVHPQIVAGGALVLSYGKFMSGSATISVKAVDPTIPNDPGVSSTFTVTVGSAADVNLGADGIKSVTYTDAHGTTGTITLSSGTAGLHFTGTNVKETIVKGNAIVTGTNLSLDSISTRDTTIRSTLKITAKGGSGVLTLNTIKAATGADLGTISAKNVQLTGSADLTNIAVKEIDLASANGAKIGVGSDQTLTNKKIYTPLTLNIGSVTDSSLVAEAGIKTLKSGSWISTSNTSPSTIKTTGIQTMTVNGDFAVAMQVLGGTISNAKIAGNMNVDLSAGIVQALQVGRTFSGTLDLTGFIQTMKATTIDSSTIVAVGGIGSINATTITSSQIATGVTAVPSTLPTANTKSLFNSSTSIVSLASKFFSNSFVVAPKLGKIALGKVTTSNHNIIFGLGAHEGIKSVSFTNSKGEGTHYSNLVPGLPRDDGDFEIIVV